MSSQGEAGRVADGGVGNAAPARDDGLDVFSGAISKASEVRKRGVRMMAVDEDAYLAAAEEDEDYQEEMRAELEAARQARANGGVEEEGTGESEEYFRVRVPPVPKPAASAPSGADEGAGARPAAEAGPAPAPEGVAEPGTGPVEAKPVSPSGGIGKTVAAEVGKSLERAGEATLGDVSDVLGEGIRMLGQGLDRGLAEIRAAVPHLAKGEVGELVSAVKELERAVRVQEADEARRRGVGRRWWLWPARVLAVAALLGMFAGGLAVQSRWSVMDDGTNGWKDIVWDSHGMRIAECMDRAERRGGGAECGVSVGVR